MLKNIIKWFFALVIAFMLLIVGHTWIFLNFHITPAEKKLGLCEKLGRRPTDEEKIRLAIQDIESQKSLRIDNKYYPHVPYMNVDEVLLKNPGCCKIVASPSDSIFWPNPVLVEMNYPQLYIKDEKQYSISSRDTGGLLRYVSKCGYVDLD